MSEYGVIEKNIDKVKQWLETGLSGAKIAILLNCTKSSVNKKIREHKLNNSHKSDVDYNNLLKNKKDLVINLFNDGYSINRISKQVNHATSSIRTLLIKEGYNTYKYKCKYSLNESYFEVIDTPNKAYCLGLWYTDGNVMKSGKSRIQLEASDRHILEDIKGELSYTGELIDCKPRKTSKAQVCLSIDRKKVSNDLIKLGCYPNKSLTLKFPTVEQVPEHLLSHFIRGVFDGDGSISIKKKKYITVGITSTDMFCNSISNYLSKFDITPSGFYYRRKGKSTGSLFFGRGKDAKALLELIYKDAELKLNRKYQKYLQSV